MEGLNESGMPIRICPVCKTKVFTDMDTCFNCMYRFGSEPALEHKVDNQADTILDGKTANSSKGECGRPFATDDALFREFLVKFESFLGDFLLDSEIGVK